MKSTVTRNEFIDGFCGGYANNFSYDGKVALFEHFEEFEESCGEELEFDPIAICCDYNEYDSLEEFHGDYNKEEYPTLDIIEEHTQVIPIEGTERFIIGAF